MKFCKQFVTGRHSVRVTLFKLHLPATELLNESSLNFAFYV